MMEFEENGRENKDMVITQVSFGGIDKNTTAKELTLFLEYEIGLIWRCRLKNSWTPPDAYPNYDVADVASIPRIDQYEKVEPHAFVHFALPEAATRALNVAASCELIFREKPLIVSLGPESPFHINQRRRKTDPFKFPDVQVEFGTLASLNEFYVGWKGPSRGVDFIVDPFDGTCKILFTKEAAFEFKGLGKYTVIKCNFKLEFKVREIIEVKQYKDISSFIVLIHLASSPSIYYRTADDDIYDSVPFNLLDDEDPWIRTTDFTSSEVIGRCSFYRICVSPRYGLKLEKAMKYMKDRRVPHNSPRQLVRIKDEPPFSTKSNAFFCIPCQNDIGFDVMFMVNAVMHKGIFNPYQLSDKFFGLLRNQTKEVNLAALSHIYCYRHPVFDAYKRLKIVQEWLMKNPKLTKGSRIADGNVDVRRVVITPTKAYCLPPEVELSNRVLRHYKEVADRFLRVTFMDEGMQQLNANALTYFVNPIVRDITKNSFPQKTTVFKRVRSLQLEGFSLCGRNYSFLAFSSNQLRDRSAWFFAEDETICVHDIKNFMGRFSNKNVAKCAARMGQCFSSTYATVEVPHEKVNFEFPDIRRNGYVFSDGIGIITPDLAAEVANKLELTTHRPCAYQIRYAGCKGVIVSWPRKGDDKCRLYLRPSMNKFESDHTIIEVVTWTKYQPGFLNRQIVTLLSSLGVPDGVFSEMQDSMVYSLSQMLSNNSTAFEILTLSCGEQGNTAAAMLTAGFKPQTEPHLKGILSCIRATQSGDLLDKARIFVPSARWLMGCLDELGVLEQGKCFIQVSTPTLENYFIKDGSKLPEARRNVKVIKGTVAIAKNPCLHPGDVRILEAVDDPRLHHLVDCLVFPQKGDRPHSNEASGSDLDGDLYFVTWDQNLIPPSKRSWPPMDYSPVEETRLPRNVTHKDIVEFFTKNMVNENLGVICNAHVVHADQSEYGALDEKCIKLAELAATAVDFPKTGKLVTMPHSLKPKIYPDFMGKEGFLSYKSKKILGVLYRKVKNDLEEEILSSLKLSQAPAEILYDIDLEISCPANVIQEAWNHKCAYNSQLSALLGQYKVGTEEEVVSGHIWSMPKYNGRKQRDLKERLKHTYHVLKKEYKQIFEDMQADLKELPGSVKDEIYEQKASAWYQVTYHPYWVKKSVELKKADEDAETDYGKVPTFLSFAWIPLEHLIRIKTKHKLIKY